MKPSIDRLFSKRAAHLTRVLVLVLAASALGAATASAQPGFSKSFSPSTIGPGSTSTLTFLIDNTAGFRGEGGGPVENLAFVDNFPLGMTVAGFANTSSSCDGVVAAVEGASSMSFSGGMVGAGSTCTVTVDVVGVFVGEGVEEEMLSNVSGDLTSDAGNSGPASADLTVSSSRPGFSKTFSPDSVELGERSTLTFDFDNSGNPSTEFVMAFTDVLPTGLVVAGPANITNTCTGGNAVVNAVPGSSVVGFQVIGSDPSVASGSTCSLSVDVVAVGGGMLGNASGDLTSFDGISSDVSGAANDILDVTVSEIHLIKAFTDDPAPPEGTTTLEFTIRNFNRLSSATGITFTDDLEAVLSGLEAVGLPANDVCGAGSTLTGTSLITLTGGNLPPEGTCTFSVTLQLPTGNTTGSYVNTTSAVSGDVGGSPTVGNTAEDTLFVAPGPALTKTFLTNPTTAGGTTTIEFTITNTSPDLTATDIAFTDTMADIFEAVSPPANDFCGTGSTAVFFPPTDFDPGFISVSDAELAAGASCTFSFGIDIIDAAPGGTYPNVTSEITATVDGSTVTGVPASDDLEVLSAPTLGKEFTDDPADPNGTVTLEFTISHDDTAPGDATAITFMDDLDAALSGLEATGLPAADVCGTGSSLAGTSTVTLTGGTLSPGETCVFSVTLQVPSDAPAGPHTNTTSPLNATVGGQAAIGAAASDDLMISGLDFSKEFTDDPVIPGDSVTLSFTIDNISPVSDATGIFFIDNLSDTLAGLVGTGLPLADPCGSGSSLVGSPTDANLVLTGGNLLAGTSCTFEVVLDVPGGAADGQYGNTTSALQATMEGGTLFFDPASDILEVSSQLLDFSKEFTDDPVAPGDNVTLEFTITNLDPARAAADLTFTDDLDAALSGLEAVGLPANDVCGAGSQITGTSLLTLTGGSLPAAGSCTFSVTLLVPGSVDLGTVANNVTSDVTGTIDGLDVAGNPATAELLIDFLSFSKTFSPDVTTATGSVDLTFSITNESSGDLTDISFTDDLDAVISGLEAVGLPQSDDCGAGSEISGTSFLTFSGGNLLAGASCSIVVTLQLPDDAPAGTFPNTTSDLFQGGVPVSNPATDDLTVEPPPTFAKAFDPAVVNLAEVSVLTFTIDNSASSLPATSLDFTDDMPVEIEVADPSNASTSCTGGTITADPGTSTIAYTGGEVAAGATCTVSVDVVSFTVGTHPNVSGDLTSSAGNSGDASASLTVVDLTAPQVTVVDTVQGTGDGMLEECETAQTRISQFLVTFDEPMDAATVMDVANWDLFGAGPDRDVTTVACGAADGDDVQVTVLGVTYDGGTMTATVDVDGPLPDSPYRLFASCGGGILDLAGNPLDGDGDGTGGDDFIRNFRVDERDAFDNGNFDCSLDDWTTSSLGLEGISFSSEDIDDATFSGSARFEAQASAAAGGGTGPLSIGQCVEVLGDSTYDFLGFVNLNTPGVTLEAVQSCDFFTSSDCSGSPQAGTPVLTTITSQDVWEKLVDQFQTDPTFGSALCQVTLTANPAAPYVANVDNLSLNVLGTDVIFTDGFESGDTSAWSSTVP